MNNPLNTLKEFSSKDGGAKGYIYSLKALEKSGFNIGRLPVSIKIVLESVLRNCDGKRASESDVKKLAAWNAANTGDYEVPFVVSRIVLQDFTGVPLLVDLAAMRDAAKKQGKNPSVVEPLVPVDLIVDHSVQMDFAGTADAHEKNLEKEFERNKERYEFLKWGQQAFKTFSVIPPATGIIHQINLEYLANLVFESKDKDGKSVFYPDTLVGTDSHTTMINGLGVVGWGVGGIEAEAGMLGQPVYFRVPEVVGVHVSGKLEEGVTATDLALFATQMLRKEKVVGKFVEFFGEGAKNLSLADRTTIANMAPEYGATMGYFPVDETTLQYLKLTGRDDKLIALVRDYFKEQGIFGIPSKGDCDYSKVLELDLSEIKPCIAGPKRPQDKINLGDTKDSFKKLLEENSKSPASAKTSKGEIKDGSVLIAAITSCTNTSNPSVMIAAGLVAKKAAALGIKPPAFVKTTIAPGSRVVTDYLKSAGLQESLDKIGFTLAGYGCATCIGNSGPIDDELSDAVKNNHLICASVLSGNRNFEARVHPLLKANYLMSPPLVVAFALAGRVDIDFDREPISKTADGKDVFLSDIWPTSREVEQVVSENVKSEMFKTRYQDMAGPQRWQKIESAKGSVYEWDKNSTYIQNPPFFETFSMTAPKMPSLSNLKALAILGDSVTTDHISPAGCILTEGPAGKYLMSHDVDKKDFNSYGSRRGNDRVMTRGTFANVRIKNKMADAEGGFTKIDGKGDDIAIFDACEIYKKRGEGLIVFSGVDYGMGSSRDWAAKGTNLLGVRAVVAKSFERIHRSNLVGMGVLPFEFENGQDAQSLGFDGTESFSIIGLEDGIAPSKKVTLLAKKADGGETKANVTLRIDTPIEVEYYKESGILPYVLKKIISE